MHLLLVGELTCTRMALSSLDSCALKTLTRCGVVWRGVVWCGVVWLYVVVLSGGLGGGGSERYCRAYGDTLGGGTATQSHVNIGWNKESI